MIGDDRERAPRGPLSTRTEDAPLWKQAATGIGLVTLGALAAVSVGLLMAAVLSWLF
ncbi:MAG: hypothetical protein ACI9AD_000608 [Nitriliruptoraceae bacterium]|jgi:hypothetical protein